MGPYINTGTAQISTQAQTAHACEVFIGYASGDSGSLFVNHGTLDQCGDIFVGWQGKGKLAITNGGIVNTFFNPSIASEQNSNGSVAVDGQNSQWTVAGELEVGGTINGGAGGTGVLTVTNSGTVTAASVHVWKSGTLTGNSTVSTPNGGTTTLEGTLAPNWTLTINGDLTFANPSALMQCTVTSANLGSIDAEVSGAASLNGKLSVTVNSAGDFTLLHADGGIGTTPFSSYSFIYNGCFFASIEYDRTHGNVILHVVATCN